MKIIRNLWVIERINLIPYLLKNMIDKIKWLCYFYASKSHFVPLLPFDFGFVSHSLSSNTIYIQVLSQFPILSPFSSLLPNLWRLLKNVVVEWIYLKSWAVKYIEFSKKKNPQYTITCTVVVENIVAAARLHRWNVGRYSTCIYIKMIWIISCSRLPQRGFFSILK